MKQEPLYIDTPTALSDFCEAIAGAPRIAIDTEFLREKTYHARLCLIQVATPEQIACIDPLAIDDLTPLLDRIYDESSLKILHAARQDIEILHHLHGRPPAPIFDTQIAASVLGHGEQTGYGNLVREVLDIELEKGHARTDWSRRPLSPEQITYAADDVRYLFALHHRLDAELGRLGRRDWLEPDFTALSDPQRYQVDSGELWRKVSGLRQLRSGDQLAVLRELVIWREAEAQRSDRPRKWVLDDETLLDLARRQPTSEQALGTIRGLEPRQLQRIGSDLLSAIEQGRAVPEAEQPQVEPRHTPVADEEAISDALMALLRQRAAAAGISPSMLATRRHLERMAAGERDLALLSGWRRKVAGEALLDLIEGRSILHIEGSRLLDEVALR